jgi:mRNA interferase RelE/StbE
VAVVTDRAGGFRVEVAEVWAVGYRKDSEVYAEVRKRVDRADSSPRTKALTEVLGLFVKQTRDLTATPEPDPPEPVPRWLTDALLHVVRLPAARVKEMNLDEAEKAWTAHISGAGSGTSSPLQQRL